MLLNHYIDQKDIDIFCVYGLCSYLWFKSDLREDFAPKFDLSRVQTHDLWIMYRILYAPETFVLTTEPSDFPVMLRVFLITGRCA